MLFFEKSEFLFAFGPRLKTDDPGSHQSHCGSEAILALKTGDPGEQVCFTTRLQKRSHSVLDAIVSRRPGFPRLDDAQAASIRRMGGRDLRPRSGHQAYDVTGKPRKPPKKAMGTCPAPNGVIRRGRELLILPVSDRNEAIRER